VLELERDLNLSIDFCNMIDDSFDSDGSSMSDDINEVQKQASYVIRKLNGKATNTKQIEKMRVDE